MSQDRDNMDYAFFNNSKKIYVYLNHRVAYGFCTHKVSREKRESE